MKRITKFLSIAVLTLSFSACGQTIEQEIYPTSISISGPDIVEVNKDIQLNAIFEPENTNMKKISWAVNDTSIAAINNSGLLTGRGEGNVVVTATSRYISTVTTQYNVTVVKGVVPVSSISLDLSSVKLTIGKSAQLNTTISPSDATNQNVTWSSENNDIVSVTNDGVITANQLGSTTVSVTTEDGGFSDSCTVNVVKEVNAKWTIMIYMCGSSLESGTDDNGKVPSASNAEGIATSDIEEILSVDGQPDDVNIIIETGGSNIWKTNDKFHISNHNLERWHISDHQLIKDASLAKANMGLEKTFESFLEWGLTEYPAEKTGVIMWNHGGAMRGVCYDETANNDRLLNSEVNSAFSKAFLATNRNEKLEFIGYDACMMQLQDVADVNSQYFNYMIASQEEEAGFGWDYDSWIDDIYSDKSTETILTSIVDGFIADNGGTEVLMYQGEIADQTLSYLDLSKMGEYKDAWESLAGALSSKINSNNKRSFSNLVRSSKTFADDEEKSYLSYGTFDVKDFIIKLQDDETFKVDEEIANAVLTAHNNLVKYYVSQQKALDAHGLSMFWAISSNTKKGTYYNSNETSFTIWQRLNSEYGY